MEIKDLQETASLAHLSMSAEELQNALPAFEQMLGFFQAMQAADKDETAFPDIGAADPVRPETVVYQCTAKETGEPGENLSEKILEKAGKRDGNFIIIPQIQAFSKLKQ